MSLSSRSSTPSGSFEDCKDVGHLALFQTLGDCMRSSPREVIDQLTRWVVDPAHPALWTPFALSMRAVAFEELGDERSARDDYAEARRLYRFIANTVGEHRITRMRENVRFVDARLRALPAGPGSESPSGEFVVVDEPL